MPSARISLCRFVFQILFEILFSVWVTLFEHTVENVMKSRTKKDEVDGNFHEVKGKTEKRLRKPMKDPTLEGKDENKVGRVQEKIGPVD